MKASAPRRRRKSSSWVAFLVVLALLYSMSGNDPSTNRPSHGSSGAAPPGTALPSVDKGVIAGGNPPAVAMPMQHPTLYHGNVSHTTQSQQGLPGVGRAVDDPSLAARLLSSLLVNPQMNGVGFGSTQLVSQLAMLNNMGMSVGNSTAPLPFPSWPANHLPAQVPINGVHDASSAATALAVVAGVQGAIQAYPKPVGELGTEVPEEAINLRSRLIQTSQIEDFRTNQGRSSPPDASVPSNSNQRDPPSRQVQSMQYNPASSLVYNPSNVTPPPPTHNTSLSDITNSVTEEWLKWGLQFSPGISS